MAAHGAGSAGSVSTDLKLIFEQVLGALIGHNQHDQVDTFRPYLQTPAAAANAEECRCAPASVRKLAGSEAPAVLATEDESAFNQVGHHGDTFGALVNLFRNSLIGSRGK